MLVLSLMRVLGPCAAACADPYARTYVLACVEHAREHARACADPCARTYVLACVQHARAAVYTHTHTHANMPLRPFPAQMCWQISSADMLADR